MTVPLNRDQKGKTGWMVDLPYVCKSGVAPKGGCLGPEGTITSIAMTFNTDVIADETLGGKTVQVLFGGIQWGFKYQNSDKTGIVIADAPRPGGGAISLAMRLRRGARAPSDRSASNRSLAGGPGRICRAAHR